MSDTVTTSEAPAGASAASTIWSINVTKAKTTIDVDVGRVPNEVYQAALKEGLKTLINSNSEMNKVKAETFPNEDERKAKALEIAQAKVQEMYEGKLKLKAERAAAGPSGAVMTEARRLARIMVKDALRAQGLKVSHYAASEITAAANDMIKADPALIAQAEKNLAARGKLEVSIDVSNLKEDPKLVAKAEKEKAERAANKVPLSAKQAGKVAPHATAH